MNKLIKFLNISLAEILTVVAEFLIIGLLQMIFSYGAAGFLVTIYVIGRLNPLTKKLVLKALT